MSLELGGITVCVVQNRPAGDEEMITGSLRVVTCKQKDLRLDASTHVSARALVHAL